MLGSFAEAEDLVQEVLVRAWRARDTYAGDAPLLNWLMRIATNACLNALTRSRPRALPQLDRPDVPWDASFVEVEASTWITPAPDAQLWSDPSHLTESRETVALAFIALLQRLSPKQRAALLLKDVLGWSAEDIAEVLALSVSAVSSALHRARETVAVGASARALRPADAPGPEPSPAVLAAYVRSWETHDLERLVALLREEVILAMPPHQAWLRGLHNVSAFLKGPRFAGFWARGLKARATRANGLPSVAWYVGGPDGRHRLHSLHIMRFENDLVAEAINFIGPTYLHGFGLSPFWDQEEAPPPAGSSQA